MSQNPISIEDIEKQTRAQTQLKNPEEVELAERLLELLLSGFALIDGMKILDDRSRALLLLTTKAFNSLWSSFDLLLRGYYVQSLALIRTAEEDWVTAAYLWHHPEFATKLLSGTWSPKIGSMRKALGELRAKSDEEYEALSRFARPSTQALWAHHEPGQQSFSVLLGSHYDSNIFFMASYSLIPLASKMHGMLGLLGAGNDLEWANEAMAAKQEVVDWIRKVNAQAGQPYSMNELR